MGRYPEARLAQSVERKALNLVVVGSSPTVGVFLCSIVCRVFSHADCGSFLFQIHMRVSLCCNAGESWRRFMVFGFVPYVVKKN